MLLVSTHKISHHEEKEQMLLTSTHSIGFCGEIKQIPYLTNYCTVRRKFKKLLEKLGKIHQIRAHFKESSAEDFMRRVLNDAYAI